MSSHEGFTYPISVSQKSLAFTNLEAHGKIIVSARILSH
jgi:hypothetical protein